VVKEFTNTYKVFRSVQSSQNLRRTASENALTLEQRRQELELRKLEADIKQQEEAIRLQQLKNEQLELDLMERRARIQESQASSLEVVDNQLPNA
jgi:multidrug resistance efflux pump